MSEPSEETLRENLVQFYDGLAPIYDLKYANPSIDYMKKVEWSIINRYTRGRRLKLLDLGCGTGSLAVKLATQGHELLGVDISPQMITIARRNAAEAGVESRTQFIVADIEKLPPILGRFEFAYSTFGAFNHVRNLRAALEALSHVLSNRGHLFFSLANRMSIHSTHGDAHNEIDAWKKIEMKEVGKAVWTRFYARNEVETALGESGFCPTSIGGVFYLVRPSYVHSDRKHFGLRQGLMARTESLMQWRSPANLRAAYLLFVAQKAVPSE